MDTIRKDLKSYNKEISKGLTGETGLATWSDLDEITTLESLCFPKEEAASRDSFSWRLKTYPTHFFVLRIKGRIISFINGPVTKEPDLMDEMYDSPVFHDEKGEWQMIFGVVTHPDFQKKGYASRLLECFIDTARKQRKKGVVLTCKEAKIPFYHKFGFEDEGLSVSTHGGVPWHQMRLTF